MSQIKHKIIMQDGFIENKLLYYFNFEDYLSFTEKSDLYKKEDNLLYINLPRIYFRYNKFRKLKQTYGLLHVVNIQRAFGYLNKFIVNNNEADFKLCIKICDSILAKSIINEKYIILKHNFNHPGYSLKAGWVSAMAQGMFASLLFRVSLISENKKYYDAALKSLNYMFVPVKDDGPCVRIDEGFWFLEYTRKSFKPFVLNGNIFSILALYDLYLFNTDGQTKSYLRKFEKAVDVLANRLKYYKGINSSYYDYLGTRADDSYNALHVVQLTVLFKITGLDIINDYACTFSGYEYSVKQKRNISFKSLVRILFKLITLIIHLLKG